MVKNIILHLTIKHIYCSIGFLLFMSCQSQTLDNKYQSLIKEQLTKDQFWDYTSKIYQGRFKKNAFKDLLSSKNLLYDTDHIKIYSYDLALGCSDCFRSYKMLLLDVKSEQGILLLNFENDLFDNDSSNFSLEKVNNLLNKAFNETSDNKVLIKKVIKIIFEDFMKWEILNGSDKELILRSNYQSEFSIKITNNRILMSLIKKGSIW